MKKTITRKKVSLHSRLKSLLSKNGEITVTYVFPDRSIVKKVLSEAFLTVKGKTRKINDIVNDLHALNHDKCAKYFYI